MKNKFMTKALAVALSASMALSLSSATALTANAAAAPKLNKKTVTVKAGKKAKVKLKAASYKAGWRITKATVKKAAKAKAKVKKNKKVVVVTGVSKGATKVVLKLKNAKTGASKNLKFKAKVTVDEVIVEPTVETTSITGAKQISYDSVELTFDKAVDSTTVSQETVAINGSVGAATAVTVSGNQAVVNYGYAENTDYTFSVTNFDGTAKVSVGSYAVTDIAIADQTFEADNEEHVVEFALKAGDVDVTKYGTLLGDVQIDFADNYTSVTESPTKPTITFAEPDMVATVTVKYDNGKDPAISKSAKLTSIKPVATAGDARFATVLKKWYLVDDNQDSLDIFTSADSQKVYFYSKNSKTGKAVKYSDLEVKSSNETVATADASLYADGKYAEITITPTGEAGTVKFTVVGTEAKGVDSVTKEYDFTVKVSEKNNTLNKIDVGTTTARPYNGYYGYESKFKMQPQNSIGQKLDDDAYDVTIEVSGAKDGATEPTVSWGSVDSSSNKGIIVNSLGATAGTYTFKVTISDLNNDKELTSKATVTVQDALAGIFEKSELNGKLISDFAASKIALETKDLSITDYQGATVEGEMKAAVYVKSKPIGYLTTTGITGYTEGETIARRAVAAKLKDIEEDAVNLYGFHVYVFNGNNYYCNVNNKGNKTLYLGVSLDGKTNLEYVKKEASESSNSMLVGAKYSAYTSSNNMVQPVYFYGASSKKNTLAAAGKYSAILKYNVAGKETFADGQQIAAGSFNVSYAVTMPKVEYNLSESADGNFAVADVDLVRAADGASVYWTYGAKDSTKPATIQGATFTQNVPASGSKVYGVMVNDYRGGGWWNAAEYGDYVGGQYQDNILFHFMYEMNKSVKA